MVCYPDGVAGVAAHGIIGVEFVLTAWLLSHWHARSAAAVFVLLMAGFRDCFRT